ncbi:cell wall metabolism sensor histidine kinase WalK [Sinomonas atrocyanea]|uniref:sensor histidine kinase n=1 Tax=Sinomonas atrocyanea TaxID=37927 RepID=UPI002788B727|nr:HAMP domain-containing sensor histidine kinase [Sinomonas atrocyanea]MDQ0261300.1 two-component system OmpR family sensor kinase [Sinomonas atrocyanea]MDR6623004.1 two-component system OmpR family sensor kinase [Sinomonas atrocyanea]
MLAAWKRASLRTQLVAIMMVLLTGAIFLTAAATVTQLRTYLVGQLDARLDNASEFARNNQDIDLLTTANPMIPQDYVLVIYPQGGSPSFYYSPDQSIGRPDIPSITPDEARAMQQRGEIREVRGTVNSVDWRYTAIPVRIVASNTPATIVIALPLTEVEDAIQHTLGLTAGVGIVTLALVFAIATWTVTRAFRPLRRVEKTAAAIAAGDLSQRVDEEAPGTELGRLSTSLNAMLAHIEVAFQARMASEARMRRFISDASHELRTPLVTIRGFSELYRHGALATQEDVATAMGRIESEAKRMGTMVEDLLTLARLDEQRPLTLKPLDLLPIGHDAVVDMRATAPDRTVRLVGLDSGSPAPAPTLGDEARIRQVVGNIVGNALQYTPPGSPLEVAVGTRGAGPHPVAVLELRDHGPGIGEKDAAKIFERFYRADSSRTRDTGGTGLGLAIVAAIVGSHHGTVRHHDTPGGGSTFVIEMPYVVLPERPTEPPPGAARSGGAGSGGPGSERTTAGGSAGGHLPR